MPNDSNDLKNLQPPKRKRGRPNKESNPIPNQPPASADSVINPASEETPPGVISVDIESHGPAGEPSTWQEKLKRASERVGLFDEEDSTERIETRGRKKKGAVQDEFSTLVIALLTLAVSFVNIPEQVKPNQSELSIFSNHLTGIMIRHLPISNKFSADSLDIIGLVAVCSGWYARVAPEIRALQPPKTNKPNNPPDNKPGPGHDEPKPPAPGDPVLTLSPAAADYLASVEKKAIQNASAN